MRNLPYTVEILRLSSEISNLGRLPPPALEVELVSPLCGSRLRFFATMADGRIQNFAWEIEACALGQASAALIGARADKWSLKEVADTAQAMERMLQSKESLPFQDRWLEPLLPARSAPQRHGSVLLPIRAFQKIFLSTGNK